MWKIDHRHVMQNLHLKALSSTNIKTQQDYTLREPALSFTTIKYWAKIELDYTLGNSVLSFTTVKYWMTEFKRSHTICPDEHRSDRLNEVTTPKMEKKIHKIVLNVRWLKAYGASRNYRYFEKCRTLHIDWNFGHEEVVRKMGAAFVHNWTKTMSFQSNIWRCFTSTKLRFAPIHNHEWNMVPSHQTLDERTVRTTDWKGRICSK